MTLLDVRDLSKHFPVGGGFFRGSKALVRAVEQVSFTVNEGETLGLVGESGCGKSTLGRTLLRLEEATSGTVRFGDKDVLKASRSELFALRRDMQMVFQDPYSSLNPRLTVGESVAEPLEIHRIGSRRERREMVRELFRKVGLRDEMLDRFPNEFSGGQRQRVGLARALALRPRLIVADEPVSALDVSVQAQVLNLMAALQREFGLTYIFISHDLSVVDYISDRIAVMYLGRIVEIGPRERVFRQTAHPYSRALIASSPIPDPTRRGESSVIRGEIASPLNPPSGCAFNPRCPLATEQCLRERPELLPVLGDASHQTACHHAPR
ncbi:dipeptide ABC transporter ATP-binding protein [bacterium]|nr:dipeptide ABC transporter ATP-binding protein [bacterium]